MVETLQKGWTVAGGGLWIAGLVIFIVGLNLAGEVRGWLTVIGSILFLLGLGITGAVWLKRKKDTEE